MCALLLKKHAKIVEVCKLQRVVVVVYTVTTVYGILKRKLRFLKAWY